MRCVRVTIVLLAAAVVAPAAWKAGVARVKITPGESIWMAGYAARTKPSEGIRQDLWMKALALQDDSGAISVLATFDLSGIKRDVGTAIAERAAQRFGIPRDRLLLNASHTHSGPVTGQNPWPKPGFEGQQDVVNRYTARLIDQAVQAIGAAIADLAPATLSFHHGLAGIAVNRRRDRAGMRHLPAPVDHDVPVLAVRGADGRLRAVAAGYACHATVLADYQINGDWPGYAQEELEKVHAGATALFVAGCGADANPLPRRSVALAQRYGQVLADAVGEALKQKPRPVEGPLRAAFEIVDLPFHTPAPRAELERRRESGDPAQRRHAGHMLRLLDRYDNKLPPSYPYPVQVWRFGGLKLIALGGEVVADYSLRLKARHGWEDTWVAAYSNDVFGYVPSRRVLEEGGYEGGDSMIGGSLPGPFAPAVEEIIVDKVGFLMERLGYPQAR
jgi:hypothetical protein